MMKTTSLVVLVAALGLAGCVTSAQSRQGVSQVMPRYDARGALLLPDDYRRWILVGSQLDLSYTEAAPSHETFGHTLMEPSAYQYFVDTGSFREGTMFVLIIQGAGNKTLPARRGQFAAEIHGVEMAVKDTSHVPEGWAYYAFGGMNGIQKSASAMPKANCYACHKDHAARDNVFLQFYA